MPTMSKLWGSGQVAEELGIRSWKFRYLVERGDLPGPSLVVSGRRLFTEEDVEAVKRAWAERESETVQRPATA